MGAVGTCMLLGGVKLGTSVMATVRLCGDKGSVFVARGKEGV